jgi:hypothetical protein
MNRSEFINTGRHHREKGQVLAIVLVLMILASTILMTALTFVGASLKTNTTYSDITQATYAADTGIQDATWLILNNDLTTSNPPLTGVNAPTPYSVYDFDSVWYYDLRDPNDASNTNYEINGHLISPQIKNIWIPMIDTTNTSWIPSEADPLPPDGDFTPPTESTARQLISNTPSLLVSGQVADVGIPVGGVYTSKFEIEIGGSVTPSTFFISSIGIWLPQGYDYSGASTLTGLSTDERIIKSHGNQAIIWTFSPAVALSSLPSEISFYYSTRLEKLPGAVAWITDTPNTEFPYSYTWDANVSVYEITAVAGDVKVEAILPKASTRSLGSAISGDYAAVGNSLMIGSDPHHLDTRLTHSDYVVDTIPSNANVQGAYLYWSGWINGTTTSRPLGNSYGTRINFKINGNQIYFDTNGNPKSGSTPVVSSKNQTYDNSGDGYTYSCYKDVTELVRWELQRENPTAPNISGNAIYDVGPATGCTLGDIDHEKSYAGWSLVIIYSSPETLGHQLYLYDKFTFNPWTDSGGGWGADDDHGGDIDPTGNTNGPGGTITGFLVPQPVVGDVNAAKMTCFVGEGDIGYSGDFVALNAPQQYWSNPWSIPDGNPSKLWDGITLGNEPNGSGQNLPNTAAQPDNVWNSSSQSGTTYPGVDIKTFNITWASGLVQPGDTSARIDLPTWQDSWDMVYIIFSFRSSITTGGAISYLISNN